MMTSVKSNSVWEKLKRLQLNQTTIIILLLICFSSIFFLAFVIQKYVEADAFKFPSINRTDSITTATKSQYEIYKLQAEIRQIRSDTGGSLFWLKIVTLFVTVGGLVGGYLYGQTKVAKNRINFEKRKNIDSAYQEIVKELSSQEPVLRATAAVKLGIILHNFPVEWDVSPERHDELVQITKQVLAASLSIEENIKVLKTITIALVQKNKSATESSEAVNLSNLDLSGANANDAYWADVNFSYTDFFKANLANTSFRRAILQNTQFYHANLNAAVLSKAKCQGTNFKLADLRNVDFREAVFDDKTNFEGAKVFGIKINTSDQELIKDAQVDVSKPGDHSVMTSLKGWLQKTE